jgi:hypothetical protein
VLPAVRWVDVHDREGGPVLVALSVVVGERLQPLCGGRSSTRAVPSAASAASHPASARATAVVAVARAGPVIEAGVRRSRWCRRRAGATLEGSRQEVALCHDDYDCDSALTASRSSLTAEDGAQWPRAKPFLKPNQRTSWLGASLHLWTGFGFSSKGRARATGNHWPWRLAIDRAHRATRSVPPHLLGNLVKLHMFSDNRC